MTIGAAIRHAIDVVMLRRVNEIEAQRQVAFRAVCALLDQGVVLSIKDTAAAFAPPKEQK